MEFDVLKVSKIDNRLIVSIPSELAVKLGIKEGSNLKIYESKPGVISLELSKEADAPKLSDQDIMILSKLLSFRFEQRIPESVNKQLTAGERKALSELLAKNFVNIFKGSKYPKGVYNIKDFVYNQYLIQTKGTTSEKIDEVKKTGSGTQFLQGRNVPISVGNKTVGSDKEVKKVKEEV